MTSEDHHANVINNDDDDDVIDGKDKALTEPVLLVPPHLCKQSYAILTKNGWVPRPWHLQGRYGSRTHPTPIENDQRIAIPILLNEQQQQDILEHSSILEADLRELLEIDGVEVRNDHPVFLSKRAQDLPEVDARIHPEREKLFSTNGAAAANSNTTFTPSSLPAFTFIELFAGIGGFGIALEALGGQCVMASELDSACRRVYSLNFPTVPLFGDVHQIRPDQIPTEEVDLLVGGFPCQPFSSLGQQPGMDDEKGLLYLEIVRFLQVAKPKAFLLENVPGLLQMTKDLNTIVAAFESAGYMVSKEICNARGLTVTNRKRLFFVGIRMDLCPSSASVDDHPFEFPYIPDLKLRAIDVIEYGCKNQNGGEEDQFHDLLYLTEAQLNQLVESRAWKPGSHLAWPNSVCSTITSHYGVAVGRGESQLVPAWGAFTSPDRTHLNHPRKFSPRECARIMGFPNHFRLIASTSYRSDKATSRRGVVGIMKGEEGNESVINQRTNTASRLKELYRMLGNAVCPPLIAALAGSILAYIDKRRMEHSNWNDRGSYVAVQLAKTATLVQEGVGTALPITSVPPGFGSDHTFAIAV